MFLKYKISRDKIFEKQARPPQFCLFRQISSTQSRTWLCFKLLASKTENIVLHSLRCNLARRVAFLYDTLC